MNVTADQFKAALRNFAAGVTIVTSVDVDGKATGATVSAFCSVSVDPPIILVCLNAASRSAAAVLASQVFAVHILEPDHKDLAMRFAADNSEKFADLEVSYSPDGVPLLADCRARLDCRLESATPAGSHLVMLGLVEAATSPEIQPLVYANRAFSVLQPYEATTA